MTEMTSRERMMIALSGGIADRVPCAPDISYMVPCRLTGKPFYDVLLYQNPPLWKAYLDAVKFFEMDGWFSYGDIGMIVKSEITGHSSHEETDSEGRKIVREIIETPKGTLKRANIYPLHDSDTPIEKLIKDFKEDFPKIKYLFPEITGYDDSIFQVQKAGLGESGIMAVGLFPPGMQVFMNYFEGSLEAATYAYYDYPELFEELCEMHGNYLIRQLEMTLLCKPDSILTGGSGSITLQSPDMWRELSLPYIKKITKMCKDAGVISGIHSCGKEYELIKVCAQETDLNYVNPIELPPMGDCDLAKVKKEFGDKLALMGNLHTTSVMLQGSVKDVRKASLQAILDAGENGGFVLSTGDQCGRDTPDENIREMISVAKEFGQYPLDTIKISEELRAL
jgi:uroporphyrinogen decarboxylase